MNTPTCAGQGAGKIGFVNLAFDRGQIGKTDVHRSCTLGSAAPIAAIKGKANDPKTTS